MILRCTRKLLAVLKVPADSAPDARPEDWYANLLWFERRKCLLVTHAGTLFTIFEPDLRVADLRDTRALLAGLISRELAAEHLPAGTFGVLDSGKLIVARTTDRRVVGGMLDMAWMAENVVGQAGGLRHASVAEVNHALHRNITKVTRYQPPVELAAAWVSQGN